jgi:hypothetical protein
MLIKVNVSKSETYVNIDVKDVAQIVASDRESSVTLKDGTTYLTNKDEAQRLVDTMRKQDEMGNINVNWKKAE